MQHPRQEIASEKPNPIMKGSLIQKIKMLINIILMTICLFNSGMIIYKKIKPDFPIIQVYKKNINETEFPLIFHICLNEIKTEEDKNIYQSFGYNSAFEWFAGQSMYHGYNYGWSGHTENGSTIGTSKGFLLTLFLPFWKYFSFRILEKTVIEMEYNDQKS